MKKSLFFLLCFIPSFLLGYALKAYDEKSPESFSENEMVKKEEQGSLGETIGDTGKKQHVKRTNDVLHEEIKNIEVPSEEKCIGGYDPLNIEYMMQASNTGVEREMTISAINAIYPSVHKEMGIALLKEALSHEDKEIRAAAVIHIAEIENNDEKIFLDEIQDMLRTETTSDVFLSMIFYFENHDKTPEKLNEVANILLSRSDVPETAIYGAASMMDTANMADDSDDKVQWEQNIDRIYESPAFLEKDQETRERIIYYLQGEQGSVGIPLGQDM